MSSFGNRGRKVVRVSSDIVQINLNEGEHLHYRFTAMGSRPAFRLSNCQGTLWSEQDSDHPKTSYEFQWPRSSAEVCFEQDVHSFSMSFANMSKCTLQIEHHDSSHNVLSVLKDIDYESENASDACYEPLTVLMLSGPRGPGQGPVEE
jgi:hypothetical protein